MKLFSFTEAAEFTGLNIKTIRKHVQQGKLECSSTPLGRRISLEALLPYKEAKGQDAHEEPQPSVFGQEFMATTDPEQPHPGIRQGIERPSTSIHEQEKTRTDSPVRPSLGATNGNAQPFNAVPLEAHLATLELMNRLQDQLEQERRRADQSQRTQIALEFQVQQYQAALSENAESLAEARALRTVAEQRLQQSQQVIIETVAQNLPANDLDELKIGRTQPAFQKRASWWRRLFRAG